MHDLKEVSTNDLIARSIVLEDDIGADYCGCSGPERCGWDSWWAIDKELGSR